MVHLDVYSKPSLPRHGFGLFGDQNSEDLTIGDNDTFGLGIPMDQIIERNQLLFNQPSTTQVEPAQVEPAWPWDKIPASMQVCMKGVLSNIPRRSDRRNATNSWHRQGENNTLWHIANKLCSANQAACPCRLPSTFNTQRNEGVVYCEFTGNPYENLLLEHLRMFENGRQFDSGLVDSVIGVHSIEQHHLQHSGLTLFLPSSLFLKIDKYSRSRLLMGSMRMTTTNSGYAVP